MSKLSILAHLGMDDSDFTSGLAGASGGVAGLAATAAKAGAAMVAAIVAAGIAMAAAIGAFVIASVQKFAEFEKRLLEVFTLIPDASTQFKKKLMDDILGLSREFGILTEDAVPALYQAISAGVPKENVIEFMQIASKAAIAGVSSLEDAVKGITSVVNAYGRSTITAQQASDIMFTTVKAGVTNFEQLSGALFNVLPLAASANIGFKQISAAMAALTKIGVPTSVATTQLRSAIQALVAPTTRSIKIMKALGINTEQLKLIVAQKPDGLIQAFKLLEEAANGDKEKLRAMVGSVEALNAILGLTKDGAAEFNSILIQMGLSAGATDEAYGIMEKGISHNWNKLTATIESAMIKVGHAFAPIAGALVPVVFKLAEAFDQLPWAELHKWITELVKIFKDSLEPHMHTLVGAWDNLKRAMEPLIFAFKRAFFEMRDGAKKDGPALIGVLVMLMDALADTVKLLTPIIRYFLLLWSGAQKNVGILKLLWMIFKALFMPLTLLLGGLFKMIKYLADLYEGWGPVQDEMWSFKHLMDKIKSAFLNVVVVMIDALEGFVTDTWEMIKGWGDSVMGAFTDVWEWIKTGLTGLWDKFSEAFPEIAATVEGVWDTIKESFDKVVTFVKEGLDKLWQGFKTTFPALADTVETTFEAVKEFVQGIFDWVKDKLGWLAKAYEKLTGKVLDLSAEMNSKIDKLESAAAKEREKNLEAALQARLDAENAYLDDRAKSEKEAARLSALNELERMKAMQSVLIRMGKNRADIMKMTEAELKELMKGTGAEGKKAMLDYLQENAKAVDRMKKILISLGMTEKEVNKLTKEEIRQKWLEAGQKGKEYYQMMLDHEEKIRMAEAARMAALANNDAEAQARAERYKNMTLSQIKEAEKLREKAERAAAAEEKKRRKKAEEDARKLNAHQMEQMGEYRDRQGQHHQSAMQEYGAQGSQRQVMDDDAIKRLKLQVQLGTQRLKLQKEYVDIINNSLVSMGSHLIQLRKAILYNYRIGQFAQIYVDTLAKAAPHIAALQNLAEAMSGMGNLTINADMSMAAIKPVLSSMDTSLKSIDQSLQGKFLNQ